MTSHPQSPQIESAPGAGQVENEVLRRYGDGARNVEQGLCCPTVYEPEFLKILPREIVEKDYGCGNPSKYVMPGETAVDLGSGAGKICYILSQKVGPDGAVIGVDFNDEMLDLARKYRDDMAGKIGYGNVRFAKGKIQDLALDLDKLKLWLDDHPVKTIEDIHALDAECARLRKEETLIGSDTIDVVVSNCVLNLVREADKHPLFHELFRVLKPGGRAVISDIVCDEDPTASILADPELWSGCISGAFREDRFLAMFEEAGFCGIEILERQEEPWHVIDGVEFRSLTVRAWKPAQAEDLEQHHAVVYRGPWKEVTDETGLKLVRGHRMAVGSRTFARLTKTHGPYNGLVIGIEPNEAPATDQAKPFDHSRSPVRHPRETKGEDYRVTRESEGTCCGSDGTCS